MAPQTPPTPPTPPKTEDAAPPSLVGISPDQLQTILQTLGTTSATAMREAYRSQRKENPLYPERSVFNPRGRFDDEGNPQPPKARLARETFLVGVRLSDELMSEDEVVLCNRLTSNKTSRGGLWKATFEQHGDKERLYIDVPSKFDDRMGLPPLTSILRELLDGADALNPDSLVKEVEKLKAQMAELTAKAG